MASIVHANEGHRAIRCKTISVRAWLHLFLELPVSCRAVQHHHLQNSPPNQLFSDNRRSVKGTCGPGDCNDANANIRPGACDVLKDGIDQDCSGLDRIKGKVCL